MSNGLVTFQRLNEIAIPQWKKPQKLHRTIPLMVHIGYLHFEL